MASWCVVNIIYRNFKPKKNCLIIYVEFYPENNYELDDTMVAIESVKAVADIRAPFNCEIIEKNEARGKKIVKFV